MLASFDIQGCINEQLHLYFHETPLTFSYLKTLLISKKSIPEVQARVNALLTKAQIEDIEKVKTALENQAYEKQITEDKQESKKDKSSQTKEELLKSRFKQELKKLDSLLNKQREEQGILLQRTNQFSIAQMALPYTVATPGANYWINTLQQQDVKIHYLFEKMKVIQIKMNELENRLELNKQRQSARAKREQARVGYESSKQNLALTLSPLNKKILTKNCNAQIQALEKTWSTMRNKIEANLYSSLIQVLPNYLSLLQLNQNELPAIKNIIKLMKQHLECNSHALLFQESLKRKKIYNSHLLAESHSLKEKFTLLAARNASLHTTNEHLEKNIISSIETQAKNNKRTFILSATSWLLLGLTFLFSIPLILALSGSLSFITPVLLYCLVSIPTALLLCSTIGVGIASAIYWFKSRNSTKIISQDQHSMEENIRQMTKNETDIDELQLIILPSLDAKIKKEEELREDIDSSLRQSLQKSKDAIQKAEAITPTSVATLSFFNTSSLEVTETPDNTPVTSNSIAIGQ